MNPLRIRQRTNQVLFNYCFLENSSLLHCLLKKRQEQGLRCPKNWSLLFVNDHFWGELNAVIGVFLETLIKEHNS